MRLVFTQPALAAALRARPLARSAQFTWERTAREKIAVYEQVLATLQAGLVSPEHGAFVAATTAKLAASG